MEKRHVHGVDGEEITFKQNSGITVLRHDGIIPKLAHELVKALGPFTLKSKKLSLKA